MAGVYQSSHAPRYMGPRTSATDRACEPMTVEVLLSPPRLPPKTLILQKLLRVIRRWRYLAQGRNQRRLKSFGFDATHTNKYEQAWPLWQDICQIPYKLTNNND